MPSLVSKQRKFSPPFAQADDPAGARHHLLQRRPGLEGARLLVPPEGGQVVGGTRTRVRPVLHLAVRLQAAGNAF